MTAIAHPRPSDPSGPAAAGVYAVRADGGLVQIRPAQAADRVALQELNARSSDRRRARGDRGAGARERMDAERDRHTSHADRGASALERDHPSAD